MTQQGACEGSEGLVAHRASLPDYVRANEYPHSFDTAGAMDHVHPHRATHNDFRKNEDAMENSRTHTSQTGSVGKVPTEDHTYNSLRPLKTFVPASIASERSHMILGRYMPLKTIGEGTYARVKLCVDAEGQKYAIKFLDKADLESDSQIIRLKREIRYVLWCFFTARGYTVSENLRNPSILKLLRHPNIVRLYEVAETSNEIMLVQEYIDGGELFEYIVQRKQVQDKIARKLFRQMVSALSYCHHNNIIHRDLKPENLLLSEGDGENQTTVKIVDFGFSNVFPTSGKPLETFCGTPFYCSLMVTWASITPAMELITPFTQQGSPEIVNSRPYKGPEVDIWSLGVVLYTLLTGRLPFYSEDYSELYEKITVGDFHVPDHVSPLAQDILHSMLHVDPTKRATVDDLREHPWTNEGHSAPVRTFLPVRAFPPTTIDDKILHRMECYGFEDLDKVRKAIMEDLNSEEFAIYHLMKDFYSITQGERIGTDTIADSAFLSIEFSQHFQHDAATILHKPRPKGDESN
ncbi:hypothetical protein HDU93_001421 [Gonapodya sp. JEL0774]|nr:hypothetical protein HDU93_001421 [Gonapodya sp. JEL0774]